MGRAFEYRKAAKLKRWGHMARTFTKIGKQIAIAVKAGGPEPENNPMIIGAVGKMLIKVTAHGVASHGSQPEKGINAVEDMARFIALLNEIPILT